MPAPDPGTTLRQVASELTRLGKRFAIVGGFGVSLRAEVRFTRDVDLAVQAHDDGEVEHLVLELRARGYDVIAIVEHDDAKRIATVRLRDASGITVDLLTRAPASRRRSWSALRLSPSRTLARCRLRRPKSSSR